MGNTDKEKSKKFTRKIRIRLRDPAIPDSYICEVFSNSLENEDDEYSRDNDCSQKKKEDTSKPKNYFELLMSRNSKEKVEINNVNEGGGRNISVDVDDEAFLCKKQKATKKSKNSSRRSIDSRSEELKNELESADKERVSQFQANNKLENEKQKDFEAGTEMKNEDIVTIFVSPKLELSRKKTLNILNYFSKLKPSSNNSLNHQKLMESSTVELKNFQPENSLGNNKKNNLEELNQNRAKKLVVNGINKENIKLAPLFCKKNNTAFDSDKDKARLNFLYSGLPSVTKKSELKTPESTFYFPKVIHVQQRNESTYWSPRQLGLPLKKICQSECLFNKNKKFSFEIKYTNISSKMASEYTVNCSEEKLLKKKMKYLQLDLGFLYEGMKEKRDKFLAQVEEVEKSKRNSSKTSNDNIGFEDLNVLWTEKYKPKSSELLGNVNAVTKLRRWLLSWKSFNDELKALETYNQNFNYKEDSSDGDDFLNFTNDNFELKAPGNVCIISGPNGCGKTTLVYALANELDFGVLELNSSSKRTGKKVLSDLQEATQSHKVHQVNLTQDVLFQVDMKNKKGHKFRKNKNKNKPHEKPGQRTDSKISLILIEDADIVFDDHDEGFFSAINSLVQTSKRPLIFITNEPNCFYLENLKQDQCLILEMEPPNSYKSCAVLDIVSSLEGVHFEKEVLESLIRHNNFDLRKSLLELQFWTRSGRKVEYIQNVFDLGHLWWGLSKFLFKQDIRHKAKTKGRKRKRTKDLFDSSEDEAVAKKSKSNPESLENFCSMKAYTSTKISYSEIESYFRVLDVLSVLDSFCMTGSQEPIPGYRCRPKDSLTLDENMEEVFWGKRLAEQLSCEIMNLMTPIFLGRLENKESLNRKLNFESPSWEEIRWRNSQMKAREDLSGLVSLQIGRDKRGLHLDYLPALRNICRMERHRLEINPRRKNRFYHYLNNIGPEFREKILEINCEIFDR